MTKIWKLRPLSPLAPLLAQRMDLPLPAAQVLINRGISEEASARDFLNPRLSEITDPSLLVDMDRAVERIIYAIEHRRRITIYGDYDADGLTATALLLNLFSRLGIPVSYYVPDRLEEGHGLNREAIRKISMAGAGVVITVDCGTGDREEIELAERLDLHMVITDHHQVPDDFQIECPFVNPHRNGSSSPFGPLCGVGVAFFLAIALRRKLRKCGWFKHRAEPDLRAFLDLVALGTIADMVPLVGLNRVLTKTGIERMKTFHRPGFEALREITGIDPSSLGSDDLAFKFAPRINASGRLGDAGSGIRLLTTDRLSVARELARHLSKLNSMRQDLERAIFEEIEEKYISTSDLKGRKTLLFSGKGWHKGVLGIVASRLMEKYHRPVLLLSLQDGMATGSARSIEGFSLHRALARVSHLLDHYGGHDRAAGLTLKTSNIRTLSEEIERMAWESLGDSEPAPCLEIDAEVPLHALDLETVKRLEDLSPFGSGNPSPLFYSPGLTVLESAIVGERHLKLKVRQAGEIREAIGFGLAPYHPLDIGTSIHLVHTPGIHYWQGRGRVQLRVVDLEIGNGDTKRLVRKP